MNERLRTMRTTTWQPRYVLMMGLCMATLQASAAPIELPLTSDQPMVIEAESVDVISTTGTPSFSCVQTCSGGGFLQAVDTGDVIEVVVNIPAARNYAISLRTAAPGTGAEFAVSSSALTATDNPSTAFGGGSASPQHFVTTNFVQLDLPAGEQVLRFENLGATVNVDSVRLSPADSADPVVSMPIPNAGPARNPLKGFYSGWWTGSSDEKPMEQAFVENMSTVGYQNIKWSEFERDFDNDFDFEHIENGIISRAGSKNRHLILQFHIDWDNGVYHGPAWMQDELPSNEELDPEGNVIARATDYDSQYFKDQATEALNALMTHFADDERVHVIQIGTLGYFGEWHTFPREEWSPSVTTQDYFFELYKNAIGSDNFLQSRYPDHPVTVPTYGIGYTNGWVLDDDHGNEFGDYIAANNLVDRGPITGEWPPNREPDREGTLSEWTNFWSSANGLAFLRRGGYSTVLPPDVTKIAELIPGWSIDDPLFQQMHRELGYNFQVNSIAHEFSSDQSLMNVTVNIKNTGIAPFYEDWNVELAVLNPVDEVVALTTVEMTDIRSWSPGSVQTIVAGLDVTLDAESDYRLALRLAQPGATEAKDEPWKLFAHTTYIGLANEIVLTAGSWGDNNQLVGGWNVLDDVMFPASVDTDGDTVPDASDNCSLVANGSQLDTDADGFGNACDPDFNNDCAVNFLDYSQLANNFLSTDAELFDLNGDGSINFLDAALFSNYFLSAPGPSAVNEICL